MEKRIANKDITYCSNINCKQREKCFRNIDNYVYDKNGNYWFSDFTGDKNFCNKDCRKD